MERLKDEIKAKKEQINFLQKQIADSIIASDKLDESGVSLVCSCDIIVAFVSLVTSPIQCWLFCAAESHRANDTIK